MRILVFANFGLGLYKFRKELLEKLISNNDEIFVSLPYDDFVPLIEDLGCKYIRTEFNRKGKNPFADLKLLKEYRKIIKEKKPELVLTYTVKPTVYGGMACQMEGVNYVVNITGISAGVENGGLLSRIMMLLYKLGLRKATKVFFQNQANLDYFLSKRVINSEYEIIPGSGVNLKQYQMYDFPNDNNIEFAYIGRITEAKGIDYYLKAAEVIKNRHSNTIFNVCGSFDEEEYRQKIEEYEKKGVIVYQGVVNDMKTIYKKIQCTVHPTFYAEGMSNVLLESLASGRPIITTDRPGCREIVDDHINGFIVKQKDLDDLVEKIELFLSLSNEERKQMGINGREKVEKQFDRNIVIDRYCEVIDRLRKQ